MAPRRTPAHSPADHKSAEKSAPARAKASRTAPLRSAQPRAAQSRSTQTLPTQTPPTQTPPTQTLPAQTLPTAPREAPARRTPYESIKHAILTAELEPGQQLVESELAARYNVSRTPVREALLRLEQDGLVAKFDRTLYVRRRSPEEILDIYETRIVLETYAARLAADRRTPGDLLFLTHLCDRMSARKPGDPHAMADANREFHRRLWLCSRSDTLIDLLERLDLHLSRYPATTLSYPGRWETAVVEHADLLKAISQRDVELAGAIAGAHFTAARDIRLRLWSEES